MQPQTLTVNRLHQLMFGKPDETQHGIAPLVTLAWEDERTDLHGVASATYGHNRATGPYVTLTCHCGADPVTADDEDGALALLEDHARTTCAVCHGPKPTSTFPRCSACAF